MENSTPIVYFVFPPYLYAFCREGHLDIVRYLVTEASCDPSVRDDDGETPLHAASR